MSKHSESLDVFCQFIETSRDTMLANGSGFEMPPREELRPILADCLSKTTGRWRKTAPKGKADTGAHLLWTLVKFHGGNGSLWGYPHFADAAERDALDTVAIVLRRGNSSAATAWQKVLGN